MSIEAGFQSLVSGAESLISANYPSSVIQNIATLTWPSTVVIDGITHTVPVTSTSTSLSTTVSSSPTSTASADSTSSANNAAKATTSTSIPTSLTSPTSTSTSIPAPRDRRLGIGLGVGLTFLALAILAGVLFFLYRRKRRTGSYLRHQPPDDGEVESWRSGNPSWSPNHNTRIWSENEKYAPVHNPAPPMATYGGPTMISPAFARIHTDSSSSTGGGNHGYYTPPGSAAELAAAHSRSNSYERVPLASDAAIPETTHQSNRPPTPLMHEMMGPRRSPARQIERSSPPQSSQYGHMSTAHSSDPSSEPLSDPFADPSYGEPYYEPPIPARSPERRNSPQVHYPSGPEVKNFDFGLTQDHMSNLRHMGEAEGYQDGGDGWRPQHMHGR